VTFPELGHLMLSEDPDGFAEVVASFLLAGAEAEQPPLEQRARRRDPRRD
jgi:hypothetical protein